MKRVHVWGAAGYAAAEVVRILEKHPFVELGVIESASHAGEPLAKHFPLLRTSERIFDAPGLVLAALQHDDIVVMGGSHGAAIEQAPKFLATGARIIDLSADFRTTGNAVYGLPERYRDAIANAQLVANPGCYPTASLLAILPLLGKGYAIEQIVIDAKSGVTGAGRTPAVGSLFAEVYGDIRAYGLEGHRHEAEIAQEIKAAVRDHSSSRAGDATPFIFTPHVVPIARGMLADAYVLFRHSEQSVDSDAIQALYKTFYANNPFVRVLPADRAPSVVAVEGTNDAEIHVSIKGNIVRAICAIDNLGKGAAGQAVQNLNIMCALPEETGLHERVVV